MFNKKKSREIMRAWWIYVLVVWAYTIQLTLQKEDNTEDKWLWGKDTAKDAKTKTEGVAAEIGVSAPLLKIKEENETGEASVKAEETNEGTDRQGRSRGFSEQYNEEPVYRPATRFYEADTDVIDVNQQKYNHDDGHQASYGIVSDGNHDADHQAGRIVNQYSDGNEGTNHQATYADGNDEEKQGRFISLDSIKNLFGLDKDKKRPHHGRPHGPPPHGPFGAHPPPHGPFGARPPPHGPSHGGPPYKKPAFKRPPGFISTYTKPQGGPYGSLPSNHGQNKPPVHNRPHPQDTYIPPVHQRPHPQDTYIPPRPTHQQLPSSYRPTQSPTYQALDPYPTPKPNVYPAAAAIIPHDTFRPPYECTCVPEYLCRRADTVYHDGAGLIDERSKGDKDVTEKDDLKASSSNKNDKYHSADARSLEVKSDNVTLSGRSLHEYSADEDDVEVHVNVKISSDREPRIINKGKTKGRHFIPPHVGGHGGHGGCQKPLVCCKNPAFKPEGSYKPKPHVGPSIHGGIRPQQRLGICGRRANFGIHERVKNYDTYEAESNFGDYPWQVAILQQQGPTTSLYACGGVLVSPRHVLTVAHCIKKYYNAGKLKVRLGEYDVATNAEPYPYQEIYVSNVHIHPYFDANLKNLHNDLAVVELKHPADIQQPHITPICMPSHTTEFYGKRCFVTGWGKNAFGYEGKYQSRLKQVNVPIIPHGECQNRLRHTRLGQYFKLHHGFVCAGGEQGKDACTGDGGSPLVCQDNYGSWYLAGLVSWGIGCGEQHVPGVYVKVSHYHDWLAPLIRY